MKGKRPLFDLIFFGTSIHGNKPSKTITLDLVVEEQWPRSG